jgi:hypothetical protein
MQNIMKTSFFHDIMQYKPLITSQPKLFYFRQITVPNFTKCLQFSHKAFVWTSMCRNRKLFISYTYRDLVVRYIGYCSIRSNKAQRTVQPCRKRPWNRPRGGTKMQIIKFWSTFKMEHVHITGKLYIHII